MASINLSNKALLWEPAEIKAAKLKPNEARPNEAKPNEARPNESRPNEPSCINTQISSWGSGSSQGSRNSRNSEPSRESQGSGDESELMRHQSGQASAKSGQASVKCLLCQHFCHILPDKAGICGVRVNRGGQLYTLSSERVAAINLDPVEKKPLYHFYPGSYTLSLGTEGCNFSCLFCQNYSLAHDIKTAPPRNALGREANPSGIIHAALRSGAQSISYTYSEPTVFFELMLKTAILANDNGLKNIMVSNAYQSAKAMHTLKNCIQAANFDLKAFNDNFYKELCGARLAPVLDTLKRAVDYGWWVEITTLLIPGKNDNPDELFNLATFIKEELGQHVPWHISRYQPCYKLKIPSTPPESLAQALFIGKQAGLDYVYVGNIPGHDGENTYCPKCKKLLLHRVGYEIELLAEGICPNCKTEIPGEGLQ